MVDGASRARARALAILFVLLSARHAAAAQLGYAGYLGGNTTDQAFSVAVDAAGNTYVAGSTESANFPTVNALQPALKGATDAFIAKISADGTTVKYATYLGGSKLDVVYGIAVDAGGSVYVAGATNSSDFPVTPGVVQNHLKGNVFDAFVAKLSASGALVYSTYLGGSYVDIADAIAVDAGRNAYVVGYTCSYDFPTRKPFQPFLKGGPPGCFAGQDAFVARLSPNAASLVYSTFFGGADKDEATALALDAEGRVLVAGYSASNDLPVAGADERCARLFDVFRRRRRRSPPRHRGRRRRQRLRDGLHGIARFSDRRSDASGARRTA